MKLKDSMIAFYFPDIICKYPVFIGETHLLPDKLMCMFKDRATAQGTPEFNCLAGRHQFDGQNIFQVFQNHVPVFGR